MKSLILLVALVAAVAYGAYTPQAVNLIQLTDRVTVSGITPYTSSNSHLVNAYSIYIPVNASSYVVTVTNTNDSACGEITYWIRSGGAACDENNYPNYNFYCGNVPYSYAYSSDNTTVIPGFRSELAEFKAGDYAYVAVGGDGYSHICMYDLTVTINYDCPAGQFSVSQGLDSTTTTQCVAAPTVVSPTGSTTLNVSSGAIASGTFIGIYSINMPLEMAVMTVTMNITYDEVDMYGNQYSATGYSSSSYYCSDTSGSSGVTGYYTYSMDCYVPRSGQFYVSLQSDEVFNGTISFSFRQCPSGFGGYNCSFPEMPINFTALLAAPMNVFIPYYGDYEGYYQFIYYFDVPANYSSNDLLLFLSTNSSASLGTRLNGYPEYSLRGYEDSYQQYSFSSGSGIYFGLSQFELLYAGRYYFSLQCTSSSAGCNITMSAASSNPTSSTTGMVSTTGSTTAVSSTTGSTTALTTASTTGSTTALTTASTTGSTTGSTTALTTGSTTGSTTRSSTTGSTTALTTRAALTTATPSITTSSEKSGFEYIIPSFVLLLAALLF